MFKVNNKKHQLRRSGLFIVTFEHVFTPFSKVSIIDFEQVNVSWDASHILFSTARVTFEVIS